MEETNEEKILEREKQLPKNIKICRECKSLVKIDKFIFGSLHICK